MKAEKYKILVLSDLKKTESTILKNSVSLAKMIDASVKSYAKDYDVTIKGSYAFGKIKEEILKQIKSYKPDVIVLGHRDSNPLQLIGDGITKFVLKEFKGYIMISSDENALIPNEKMTLGVFNDSNKFFNTDLSEVKIGYEKYSSQ